MTKKKHTKEEWQNIVGSVVEDGKTRRTAKTHRLNRPGRNAIDQKR